MSKEKLIILLTVFIDVLGVGIVVPVLPFYVESFGATATTITFLFSVFSFCAFFSSPFLGALSDRLGRRPILIISIMSTAIGWFVFAWAQSLWLIFLGRIIDGLAAGNFPIAQSYLSDLAKNEKERTTNLGLTGAVFGVGFIIGPALGALLGSISPSLPFYTVGALATLNVIGAIFFLPETHRPSREYRKKPMNWNPFLPVRTAFRDKVLRTRYLAWFFFGLAIASQQSVFALYLNQVFNVTISQSGLVFALMGIIMVIDQGLLLKNFWLKYFSEAFLEIWLFLVVALSFLFLAFSNYWAWGVGLIIFALCHPVIRVIFSSRVAGLAGEERRGEALGVLSSVMSLSMIVGPILAGQLFERKTYWPFLAATIFMLLGFFIMKKCCRFLPEKKIDNAFEVAESL